ncbi:hypothetical protein [Antrihabitans stalagmiti]|uniref:hypothetical protein n=1 Tax=Antrihabitans stalagmiti TaxID=2799499 RepID=UPI001F3280F7|nr:hypothetical protein [Antrihabitans stalagmiti]
MITDLIPGLVWGATPGERALPLPCDDLLPDAGTTADRAISVDAPPAVVFSWLCQLRVAPYSYDLFDNFGKRSPRTRDPELVELQLGQRFMNLFDLVSFVADEHITLRTNRVVTTYSVRRAGSGSRLHVRVLFEGPAVLARALALGDLVMMRKQLLVLKELAEREAAHVG